MQYVSSYFSEGLAEIQRDGKYGYIDNTGELVIPCFWDNTGTFSDGTSKVKLGNSFFCINKEGKNLFSYTELSGSENSWSFSDDLCRVKKNGLQGYIDRKGNLFIPYEWMNATEELSRDTGDSRRKAGQHHPTGGWAQHPGVEGIRLFHIPGL